MCTVKGFSLTYESLTSKEMKDAIKELRRTDPERYLRLCPHKRTPIAPEPEFDTPLSSSDQTFDPDDEDRGLSLPEYQDSLTADPKGKRKQVQWEPEEGKLSIELLFLLFSILIS